MKKIGTVGVDSGMLLLVDPCYLFSDEEWREVCVLAESYERPPVELGKFASPDFPRAVVEMLAKKTGEQKMDKLALVFRTHVGDGRYTVRDHDDSFSVDA